MCVNCQGLGIYAYYNGKLGFVVLWSYAGKILATVIQYLVWQQIKKILDNTERNFPK